MNREKLEIALSTISDFANKTRERIDRIQNYCDEKIAPLEAKVDEMRTSVTEI